jgi:DNA repair protein RecO
MPIQHFKTEGMVLKKIPFGEADFLVRVMTRDFGKMDILAKSARKSTSKLNMHLDLMNYTRVMFIKNGDRLPTLTDAEVQERYDEWFLDEDKIGIAGKALRTIDALFPSQVADSFVFEGTRDFFAKPTSSYDIAKGFIRSMCSHEGYGDPPQVDALPHHAAAVIIHLWPDLMT